MKNFDMEKNLKHFWRATSKQLQDACFLSLNICVWDLKS